MQAMEGKLTAVPRRIASHALLKRAPAEPATRRRMMQWVGFAVVGTGAAYAVRESTVWQVAVADVATRTGEIREIALPDGTRVVLGTATAVDLHFDASERRLVLRAGEVLVTTAPDPQPLHRPFRVQNLHGTVEALGTRFTVRQDADVSQVMVFEGAVKIRPARSTEAWRQVDAGQSATFSDDRMQAPAGVPEHAAAWASGKLVAQDMRIEDFLATLGRYRTGVLQCDPAVADLQVTGVFPLQDTDRALVNLTLGLPVELVYRTRYWVTVRPRS